MVILLNRTFDCGLPCAINEDENDETDETESNKVEKSDKDMT